MSWRYKNNVDLIVIVKVNMIEVGFPLSGSDLTAVKIHRGTLRSEISTVELRSEASYSDLIKLDFEY
jgi:hypothetical protein